MHDGNQNKQVNDDNDIDVSTVRNIIADLKAMYNEFLTQIKLKQKDLIRAAKYDELESKVNISIALIRRETNPWFSFPFTDNQYNARATKGATAQGASVH